MQLYKLHLFSSHKDEHKKYKSGSRLMGVHCVCIAHTPLTLRLAKLTQRDLGMHCSHLTPPDSISLKRSSFGLGALKPTPARHYRAALLASPVASFFSCEGLLSTCWILNENPVDRSSVLNSIFAPCWASMNIKHQHKGESQQVEINTIHI